MDKIIAYLKQLELSDEEAKLYLTLLQTGPTSVRDLAETVGIKRTTAYFYIDLLVDKGLIMKLVKGSKKLVAANEPENLQTLVEAKLESAKAVQQGFPDMLKTLSSLPKDNVTNDAEIRYYKGKNGVKKIYEESLKSKELRSFVNVEEVLQILPENEQLFDDATKHNPDMKMFEIVEDSPQARKRMAISGKNTQNYLYKFLPENMRIQSTDILIYDGKVGIINLKDQINGVVLHNNDLYNNLRLLFDFIWDMLQ